MEEVIETRELTRVYGKVKALEGLDFSVAKGAWVSVLGPSGSGKSTLLHLLAGLEPPTSGTIRVAGNDLSTLDPRGMAEFRRDHIGLIFQHFYLIPYLTAIENVMVAQYFHSMADEQEALEALKRVGLEERRDHLPSQLSGGEQQRLCIARAVVNEPQIILADEPTGNLDEESELRVMDLLGGLHREGHTLVIVTHDVEIGRMAERRLYLNHGREVPVHTAHQERAEMFEDEILEAIWKAGEDGGEKVREILPHVLGSRELVSRLRKAGFLEDREEVQLTKVGRRRARSLVRRHRLAEKLFLETFEVDREQMQSSACQFEHILTPEVVDHICTFLGHPESCPHGKPIPPGACCGGGEK